MNNYAAYWWRPWYKYRHHWNRVSVNVHTCFHVLNQCAIIALLPLDYWAQGFILRLFFVLFTVNVKKYFFIKVYIRLYRTVALSFIQ